MQRYSFRVTEGKYSDSDLAVDLPDKLAARPPEWLSLSRTKYCPPHTCDAFCKQPTDDWLHFAVLTAVPEGPLKEGPAVSIHPDKPMAAIQSKRSRNI